MNSITHLRPLIIYLLSDHFLQFGMSCLANLTPASSFFDFIQILPLPQDLVLVPMNDNSVSCYNVKADELNLL
jgi:hypothetical protein